MNAREDILSAIRARRTPATAGIPPACGPEARGPRADLVTDFICRAKAAAAEVRVLGSAEQIPAAIAEVLRARNLAARIHLPPDPQLAGFARSDVLVCSNDPPGPDDASLTGAPFAIAETGTLAYPSAASRPASWHFRAGLEIAVLARGSILPDLESVLTQLTAAGALPSTLNLVTGPSRTGDIEQTLELGAHGPKALVILVVPSLGAEM
ncbi:MAG TPA: LUD domain-containing protein [Rhizomicrobium sp.]|jgi:L-lactate dehydrogenase complex protein LldG